MRSICLLCGLVFLLASSAVAQDAVQVDFGRDVLPIFKQSCVGCHGPSQQINGPRVDRRSSVFKSRRRVVPGSSGNSLLYHRLIGTEFGLQMPPTGPLRPEQISMIKTWIDQGAEWPDALANEAELPPLDPKAIAMVEALRTGDRQAFMKSVAEDPRLLNARGPEGSTPFMYAVLYSDAAMLEQLLGKAAAAGDAESMELLIGHGADVKAADETTARETTLALAAGANCSKCVDLLVAKNLNPKTYTAALQEVALLDDVNLVRRLVDHGADVNAVDPTGRTALMYAVVSDLLPLDVVKLLLERGASVNTKSQHKQ